MRVGARAAAYAQQQQQVGEGGGEGEGGRGGAGLLLHHHHQIGIKTVCGTGKTLALEGKGPRKTHFPRTKLLLTLLATFLFLALA